MAAKREGRLPKSNLGVYAAAKKLRKCTERYIVANGGRVDEMAMCATILCRGILGDA